MSRSDEELTRFTMSLPRPDYDRLGELAGLLGVSRASLMRDLIEASRPVWSVLIDAARTTSTASTAQREAMARLADQMGEQLDQAQTLFGDLAAIVGTHPSAFSTDVHRGSAEDCAACSAPVETDDGPPPSNTGVRNL